MNKVESNPGVSIVICCHNSAVRLPDTIARINAQRVPENINWEVLIVDNASTDNTAEIAKQCWAYRPGVRFEVVQEDRIGLVNARICGFSHTKYDVVSFIDDDNWICDEWVTIVAKVFNHNPTVGVCGSYNEAAFEESAPFWFEQFSRSYAVGSQGVSAGDISGERGVVFGAGMSVRKNAWNDLMGNDFQFYLVGRQGRRLLCGEDYELSLALGLAGWKVWYEPQLTLKHYLPEQRLDWMYLRRMIKRVGYTDLILDSYYACIKDKSIGCWQKIMLSLILKILKQPIFFLFSRFVRYEGDSRAIVMDRAVGKLMAILRLRRKYNDIYFHIKQAKWNKAVV